MENQYSRAVRREGNLESRKLIEEVFEICDRKWRGVGIIPKSGFKLRYEYRDHDAERIFEVDDIETQESSDVHQRAGAAGLEEAARLPGVREDLHAADAAGGDDGFGGRRVRRLLRLRPASGGNGRGRRPRCAGNLKSEIRNPKQIQMEETPNSKPYDLEERTLLVAKCVRVFVKKLPRTVANFEDVKQLVRASGSVGANYIEANESLGKKGFIMHLKISRKEAKESRFWLRLVDTGERVETGLERDSLVQESMELMSIFGSMVRKHE